MYDAFVVFGPAVVEVGLALLLCGTPPLFLFDNVTLVCAKQQVGNYRQGDDYWIVQYDPVVYTQREVKGHCSRCCRRNNVVANRVA